MYSLSRLPKWSIFRSPLLHHTHGLKYFHSYSDVSHIHTLAYSGQLTISTLLCISYKHPSQFYIHNNIFAMWCTVLTAHVSIVRTRIEALACFTQSSLSTHRLLYRHAVSVTSPYFQQHNTIHYPDRHTSPFFYYRYFYSCIYADSTSTVSIPVYKVTQDLPFLFLFIFIISKVLFLFRKLYQFQYSYFCLQNYSPLTIPMSLYKITPIRLCPFPFTK